MHGRRVMRIAERAMQRVGTVAGVAAGCVWGDACVAEAVAAPREADQAPAEVAPPQEESASIVVGGVSLRALGELFGVLPAEPTPSGSSTSPSVGALGVVGLGGSVAWFVNRPDLTPATRPDEVYTTHASWLGIAGAF